MAKATHLLRRAAGLVRQRNYQDAVEAYLQATEADPQDSRAWFGLGVCLYRVGNLEVSRIALERAQRMGYPRAAEALERVTQKAKEANLYMDFSKEEELIEYLHGKLTLFRETQIRDGLHIFGQAPQGEELVNILVAMIRFDAPNHPSIRRAILKSIGLDYEEVVDNPKDFNPTFSRTNGELLDRATHMALDIMKEVLKKGPMDTIYQISDKEILEVCCSVIGKRYAKNWTEKEKKNLLDSIRFGISLIPKVQGATNEMENLFSGFEGLQGDCVRGHA